MSFPRYERYKDSGVEWLGEVPEGWEVKPFYSVASERDEPNKGMVENNLLSLSYGRIIQKDINTNDGLLPESFETYQVVRQGDIIFRLTDLQNDKRSLRTAIVEETGIITSAYVAAKPFAISPIYLNFLFRAYDETKVFYSMGGGLRQSMKFADVKRLPTLVPPTAEQQAIAAFLDRETGKIDALVAEQDRLIALLKEKRQATISHAVTKGLNPAAPLRDSGIEWLGEVPAGWEVKKLKQLVSSIKAGPFGSALTKDMYVSSGYRVYGQEQVIPEDFTVGDYFISPEKFIELQQYQVAPDDILISCVGTFGKIAIVPDDIEPGIINPRLIRVRCADSVSGEYLATLLRSDVVFEQFSFLSRGGTMDIINIGILNEIFLVVPPIEEQSAIATFLDCETAKIDTLVGEAQQAISLLKERRSALISAAVTGKIDVKNMAAE